MLGPPLEVGACHFWQDEETELIKHSTKTFNKCGPRLGGKGKTSIQFFVKVFNFPKSQEAKVVAIDFTPAALGKFPTLRRRRRKFVICWRGTISVQ